MRVVLDALPDQTRFDQMLAPVVASPAGLTATFGELAGTKAWLAPRTERHARAAAAGPAARLVVGGGGAAWERATRVRRPSPRRRALWSRCGSCSGIAPAASAGRSRPNERRVRRRRSRCRVC